MLERGRKRRKREIRADEVFPPIVRGVLVVILAAVVIVPLAYMVLVSLTPNIDIGSGRLFPVRVAWDHYATMWAGTGLLHGMVNSAIICGAASSGAVLVGSVGGYVASRVRFAGRGVFLGLLIVFQSVPTVAVLLPLVIVFAALEGVLGVAVIGTYWAVAVAYLTFSLPLVTWFVASYVESVPREIDDAARIDGAGAIKLFLRVILPQLLPALAVAGLLAFLVGWGDLLIASVVSGPSTHTVAVALQTFLSTQEGATLPQYGTLMAASLVSAVPVVVLYIGLQRFVVQGLGGAVKG